MTDPNPPTELDEVVVTGQRARGPSPFADLQYPTKGVGQGPGGPDQDEVDPNGPGPGGPPSDESQQCMTPDGAREWNKDALAVEAIERLRDEAIRRFGENHFFNREYGALICEFSDGSIDLGPIVDGPFVGPPTGGRGTAPIDPFSCGSGTPLGFIHTHPSSVHVSEGDLGFLQYLVDHVGASRDNVTAYVIANQSSSTYGTGADRVSVAKLADKDKINDPDYEPEWVNPAAQRCP